MSINQDSNTYYVTRNGKLIGPISIDRVAFCLGRRLFTDADTISTDQLNWISISEFRALMNQRVRTADKDSPKVIRNGVGSGMTGGGGGVYPPGPGNETEEPRKSDKVFTIVAISVILLLICGIGVGGYFAYDHFFGAASYAAVKEVQEVINLREKLASNKINRREFWKKAETLASENNPLVGWLIFCEVLGSGDDEIAHDKKQREKIYDILRRKDNEWAILVKVLGESSTFSGSFNGLSRKSIELLEKKDRETSKKYICVALGKIDYAALDRLISKTRDSSILWRIAFHANVLAGIWDAYNKETNKNLKNNPREVIHDVSKRMLELKLNSDSYYWDMKYYKEDSHDYKTVAKKLKEEMEESKEFKLEVSDFRGYGFFLIQNGAISYRHLSGEKPYRAKIDGESWKLSHKYPLMEKNAGMTEVSKSENLSVLNYKGVTYLIPKKKGMVEAKVRIYKRLDLENE